MSELAPWVGRVALAMDPGTSGKKWDLIEPLGYITLNAGAGKGLIYEGLPGFRTDGASIPRLFWRLIGCPLRGRYAPAAIIHDLLYATKCVSRKVADLIFREMLLALGLAKAKVWAMYNAVRAGGWKAWNGYTDKQVDTANNFLFIT